MVDLKVDESAVRKADSMVVRTAASKAEKMAVDLASY